MSPNKRGKNNMDVPRLSGNDLISQSLNIYRGLVGPNSLMPFYPVIAGAQPTNVTASPPGHPAYLVGSNAGRVGVLQASEDKIVLPRGHPRSLYHADAVLGAGDALSESPQATGKGKKETDSKRVPVKLSPRSKRKLANRDDILEKDEHCSASQKTASAAGIGQIPLRKEHLAAATSLEGGEIADEPQQQSSRKRQRLGGQCAEYPRAPNVSLLPMAAKRRFPLGNQLIHQPSILQGKGPRFTGGVNALHQPSSSVTNVSAANRILRAQIRGWHDKKGHVWVRRNTVALIERRIRQLVINTSDGKNDTYAIPLRRPAFLARALENRLYDSAPSLRAYADRSTLEDRLKKLALILGKRVEDSQAKKREHSSKRQDLLKDHLGEEKYGEVMHIVKEIKVLRLRKGCTAMVNSKRMMPRDEDDKDRVVDFLPDEVASSDSTKAGPEEAFEDHDEEVELKASSSENYHPPVLHEVYFRCNLIDAVDRVTSGRTSELDEKSRVYDIEWDRLLSEAKGVLVEYRDSMPSVSISTGKNDESEGTKPTKDECV